MILNKRKYFFVALTFVMALLIAYVFPTFGQVTPFGMKVIAAFVGTVMGWILVDLTWGSLLGFFLIAFFDLMAPTSAVASGLGDSTIAMVVIVMAFAMSMGQMGISDVIATAVLKQKIVHKNPWILVLGLCFVSWFISGVGVTLAVLFLCWDLIFTIADRGGYAKKDKTITFLIFLIAISTFYGAMVLPFRGTGVIFMSFLKTAVPEFTYNTGAFIIIGIAITWALIFLCMLFGKFVLKVDLSKFVLPQEEMDRINSRETTKKDIIAVTILALYMVALILPSFLTFPGSSFLTKMGLVGISLIALVIPALIKVDGEPVIDLKKAIKGVDWPLIFLLAITFPLAALLRNEEAGIMSTIMVYMKPIVGSMGVNMFMIVVVIILGLLTQVTHNIVLGAMFIPFICPLCAEMGGNLFAAWYMIYIILGTAYMTPAASFNSAMVFGHERSIQSLCYVLGTAVYVFAVLVLSIAAPLINKFI